MSPASTPPASNKKFLIISVLAHIGLIAAAIIVSKLTFTPEVKPIEVSFVSEEQLESMIAEAQVAQANPVLEPPSADVEPEVVDAINEPFFENLRPLFSDSSEPEPTMDQPVEPVSKTKPLIEPSTEQDLSEWAQRMQENNEELQQKKQRDERLRERQRDQQQQNLKDQQQAQRDKQKSEREQEKRELERLKAEQNKPQEPTKKAADKPSISAEDFMGEVNNELSKQPPARNSSQDKSTAESFYARMKQKIEGNWNDSSPQTFVIPVTINLSRSGAVIRARVQKSTGNAEIDERLEKAIYDSSPLPISDDPYLYNKFFKQFTVNFETR